MTSRCRRVRMSSAMAQVDTRPASASVTQPATRPAVNMPRGMNKMAVPRNDFKMVNTVR